MGDSDCSSGSASEGSLNKPKQRKRAAKRQNNVVSGEEPDCGHDFEKGQRRRAAKKQSLKNAESGEEGDCGHDFERGHSEREAFQNKYIPWTKEEDLKLRQLVEQLGAKNWSKIAAHMPTRASKSCRLRWLNQLRPNVQTGSFTPEEDELIMKTQSELGNRWTTIAAMMPGRTDNAVKNRWNSALRKRMELKEEQQQQQQHSRRLQEQLLHREDDLFTQLQGETMPWQQASFSPAAEEGLQGRPTTAATAAPAFACNQFFAMGGMQDGSQPSGDMWNWQQGSSSQLPAPLPTSTPLIATSPPFHMPMPLMSLQPQMSAKEAEEALATVNCDVLKKVADAVPAQNSITMTSTAMVCVTPPPIAMSTRQSCTSGRDGAPASVARQSGQQHTALVQQLMGTQFAVKLMEKRQKDRRLPATSTAMVGRMGPPAMMAIPSASFTPGQQQPISWQVSCPPMQPPQQVNQDPQLLEALSATPSSDVRVKAEASEALAGSAAAPAYQMNPVADGKGEAQGQSTPSFVVGGDSSSDVAGMGQLLLMQQQQMLNLHQCMQDMQQSTLQQMQQMVPQGQAGQCSVCSAALFNADPSLTQEAVGGPLENTSRPPPPPSAAVSITAAKTQSQHHLQGVAIGGLQQADIPSALNDLVARGGPEALQDLLHLGMGTLMAAAALRQQGHGGGSDTLMAAQLHVAAQPSTQAVLTSLLQGQQQLHPAQPTRSAETGLGYSSGSSSLGAGGGLRRLPGHLSRSDLQVGLDLGMGGMGEPLGGSMVDLLGLLGSNGGSSEELQELPSPSVRGHKQSLPPGTLDPAMDAGEGPGMRHLLGSDANLQSLLRGSGMRHVQSLSNFQDLLGDD